MADKRRLFEPRIEMRLIEGRWCEVMRVVSEEIVEVLDDDGAWTTYPIIGWDLCVNDTYEPDPLVLSLDGRIVPALDLAAIGDESR